MAAEGRGVPLQRPFCVFLRKTHKNNIPAVAKQIKKGQKVCAARSNGDTITDNL
jgi:hypothetical protein